MRVTGLLGVLAVSFALLGPGAALAATPGGAQAAQARLEKADRELANRAASTKGAPQQDFLLEKKRVDGLIDAIQRGEHVDPKEIDRALGDAQTIP